MKTISSTQNWLRSKGRLDETVKRTFLPNPEPEKLSLIMERVILLTKISRLLAIREQVISNTDGQLNKTLGLYISALEASVVTTVLTVQ